MSNTSFWDRPAAGVVGLGFAVAWGSALLYWIEVTQAPWWPKAALGYVGMLITTGGMLSMWMYVGHLSDQIRQLKQRLGEPTDRR